jgi:hypothetical protein
VKRKRWLWRILPPFKTAKARRRYLASALAWAVAMLLLGAPWWALTIGLLPIALNVLLRPSWPAINARAERRELGPRSELHAAEVKILEMLDEQGERSGLDLVFASDGALNRYSVYARLERLESLGYLTSRLETDPAVPDMRRRLYSLADEPEP